MQPVTKAHECCCKKRSPWLITSIHLKNILDAPIPYLGIRSEMTQSCNTQSHCWQWWSCNYISNVCQGWLLARVLLLIWNTWTRTSSIKTFPVIPTTVTAFVTDLEYKCPNWNKQTLSRYLSCQALLATPLNYEVLCVYVCVCVCVLTCCPLAVSLTFNQRCGHFAKYNSSNHYGTDDG